jgi:DNA modification methylase
MNPVEDRRQSPRKANTGPQMIDATRHIVHSASSMHMDALEDKSIELVVTSPPYPMIQMWDEQFAGFDQAIEKDLDRENGSEAFERMHKVLDSVWEECFRVLVPGGIIAINVGDATRKLGAHFRLYHNQSRIISTLRKLGFHILPQIIWRKPTNAPNKFMGSGMLPGGAYITLEHEHIILARKGGNRRFSTEADKERRRQSAYFWEERNLWFSDLWEIRGARQHLSIPKFRSDKLFMRTRSAAFPMEIPLRLIQMFSVQGDTVLDPFPGNRHHQSGGDFRRSFFGGLRGGPPGPGEYRRGFRQFQRLSGGSAVSAPAGAPEFRPETAGGRQGNQASQRALPLPGHDQPGAKIGAAHRHGHLSYSRKTGRRKAIPFRSKPRVGPGFGARRVASPAFPCQLRQPWYHHILNTSNNRKQLK